MPEEVKFTEDELTTVKEIQDGYFSVQSDLGSLGLAKIKLERQEDMILEKLNKVEEKETSFLDKITEKYGKGVLNPETGVFTPEKS